MYSINHTSIRFTDYSSIGYQNMRPRFPVQPENLHPGNRKTITNSSYAHVMNCDRGLKM